MKAISAYDNPGTVTIEQVAHWYTVSKYRATDGVYAGGRTFISRVNAILYIKSLIERHAYVLTDESRKVLEALEGQGTE